MLQPLGIGHGRDGQRRRLNREIELKLELACAQAEAFGRLALLPDHSDVAKLEAVYFDTPDRDLAAQGLSLRIRRSGKRRVQTVKADGHSAAGLFARAEWEMPVNGNMPVLDARTPVAKVLGEGVHSVQPVFHVDVERRTWIIADQSSEIELVLDQGWVGAGERREPICEVELELKSGKAAALFELARGIDADVAVRPAVISKAERGYRLLDALPLAARAEAVALDPSTNAQAAFLRIAAACLRHYRLNEALLLDHYDAKALHQARVAIRRLRSALFLFKPMLRREDVARFQGELKWFAAELGEARNLDVLMERIEAEGIQPRLEAARREVYDRVDQWLHSARVRMLLLDLAEWLALGAGESDSDRMETRQMPAAQFAAKRMQKLYRHIVENGEHMEQLADEERHEVRKDAKKLRYAVEFFAGLFDGKKQRRRQAKFLAALEDLQTELGTLNDLAMMPKALTHYGLEAGSLSPDAGKKRKLLKAAAKAQAALAEAKRFWK